jgi:hypothetical protein
MHGGTTPSGFALPQTRSGRYSKVLPVRLAARYEEALGNKDLLSLKDDIAAAEARLGDLFERLDTGESGQRWQELRETLDAFTTALTMRDGPTMNRQLATIRRLVTQGSDDAHAWSEILKTWHTRCTLTATQTRTLQVAQQMISTEQLMLMLGVVTDAINRAVSTHAEAPVARRILADLSQEFTRIGLRESGAEA